MTYLSARQGPDDSSLRRALAWIGGFALLPAAAFAAAESWRFQPAWSVQALGWCVAAALPLGVGWLLRGNRMAWNAAAVAWSILIFAVNDSRLVVHAWCAVGAVGLAFWGVREARAERINLGFAGFALSVLSFYFSSVMDKLGRSASLIVLGLLFLGGGWLLEYMRRDLVLKIHEGQP